MFFLYQIIVSLIIVISPLIIIYRIIKQKRIKKDLGKIQYTIKKRKLGKLIWFHAASVGEILSIIPIIEKFEKKNSINQILVTSGIKFI